MLRKVCSYGRQGKTGMPGHGPGMHQEYLFWCSEGDCTAENKVVVAFVGNCSGQILVISI